MILSPLFTLSLYNYIFNTFVECVDFSSKILLLFESKVFITAVGMLQYCYFQVSQAVAC